jgi:hypothetical protein
MSMRRAVMHLTSLKRVSSVPDRSDAVADRRRANNRYFIYFIYELVRHRPLADPPGMKLLALRRQGYFGAAVGKEVGFSMVRTSP